MTKKKFSFVVIFFVAGIILAIFISTNAVREAYRSRRIENEVAGLKQEAKRIENENKQLTERIAYFETSEFQEKVAKEKLNLQKLDENVVVVNRGIKKEEVSGQEQIRTDDDQLDIPNYLKWWNFFFKYE